MTFGPLVKALPSTTQISLTTSVWKGPTRQGSPLTPTERSILGRKGIDIAKIRTLEKLFPNFLRFVSSSTKAQSFEGTVVFHTIVKETTLKRLIRATLQSAANPFLTQQFGKGAKVDAISILLTKERSVLMTVPDDMDFFDEVEISTKDIERGFLESRYSQAESYLNRLR